MSTSYYRRYRMQLDFEEVTIPVPFLPFGYACLPWHPALLERHAAVKYACFRAEIDSRVFRCLGELEGCRRLMDEIVSQSTFLPQATWLLTYRPENPEEWIDCGTIQGLVQSRSSGAVQNIGIIPEQRGRGLGKTLLLYALNGFHAAGVKRVQLEVTADNHPAVNLYRSLGFHLVRSTYRTAEVDESYVV